MTSGDATMNDKTDKDLGDLDSRFWSFCGNPKETVF